MYLRKESFSFSGCWFVAISQRTCAKGIGDDCDHEWTCEGDNAYFSLLLSGPMSADFTLHISKIKAAILIPTRRQTTVPATVRETLFTSTLGLTFLHVFIQSSHVLEQRSVVICDVCWNPPENQLLIKFSLSFVIDYCAKGALGHTRCDLPGDMAKLGQHHPAASYCFIVLCFRLSRCLQEFKM